MSAPEAVELEVFRYRPERSDEPEMERYEIPFRPDWTVLDGLNHVKEELDGTLSYRWSCRMGVCGSCGLEVDGEPVLSCAAYLEDHLPGPIRVGPLRGFPVIRDLVGDISDFVAKLERVKPWIIGEGEGAGAGRGGGAAPDGAPDGAPDPGEPHRQTPAELAEYDQYSHCINCLLCYAACPIHELAPGFLGPAAIALAQRYNLDSRDRGAEDRRVVLAARDGVWPCTFVGECSSVCPKGVDPAGAIQRYKVTAARQWFSALVSGGER